MDKQALILSLVAGYETSKDVRIELMDEDMKLDPKGGWVKYNGAWCDAMSLIFTDAIIFGGGFGVKTWYGDTPQWILDDRARHIEFERTINALPRYSVATTCEHRMIRQATKRAEEILANQ